MIDVPAAAPQRSKLYYINMVLILPALASLLTSMWHSRTRSGDFQWWGASQMALHTDAYRVVLNGHLELVAKQQMPNYLHELYVLLWPLGILKEAHAEAIWAMCNLMLAAGALLLLQRIYRLNRERTLLLACGLMLSEPFRISMGNGQQSFLELFCFCLALAIPARAGWPLGVSYLKYSFAPVTVFFAAFERCWKQLVISAIFPVTGWLIFSWFVHRSPLQTALEPFLVSRHRTDAGMSDLTSIVHIVHQSWDGLSAVCALILSLAVAFLIHRYASSLAQAGAALATAALFLLPHLLYDFVILVIPAAYLLSPLSAAMPRSKRIVASAIVIFFAVMALIRLPNTVAVKIASIAVFGLLLLVLEAVLLQSFRSSEPPETA